MECRGAKEPRIQITEVAHSLSIPLSVFKISLPIGAYLAVMNKITGASQNTATPGLVLI